MAVRGGDGVRGRRAVGRDPSRHQPVGRVENGDVERGEPRGAFARHAPQHRIDQAGKVRRLPVGLRKPHREIDGGMVGHIEKQDLRRADQQRGLDPRRLRRQAAFEEERRADGATCRAGAAPSRRWRGRARGRAPRARQARPCCRADRRAAGGGAARHRRCRRRCARTARPAARPARIARERAFGLLARYAFIRRIVLLAAAARLRQVKGDANVRRMSQPTTDPPTDRGRNSRKSGNRPLTPAAERALAEAAARRAEHARQNTRADKESAAAAASTRPATATGKSTG